MINFVFLVVMELNYIYLAFFKIFNDYNKMFMMLMIIEMINLNILLFLSYFIITFGSSTFLLYIFIMIMDGALGLCILMKNFRYTGCDLIKFISLC
uniref:NADH dehydrogenase subunit 4L n=1 Tax=Parasacculina yatsui TaxID=2836420 RepID=UPI002551CEB3|nr:NADH dehydrogenase subunit 4L [Parasacculina yatsui]WGU20842.1 NADH dehydrogenase subunit 4L [Parasacculina yatsui]